MTKLTYTTHGDGLADVMIDNNEMDYVVVDLNQDLAAAIVHRFNRAETLAKALEELLTVTKDQADEPESPIFLAHAAARTAMYEYRKAEK